MRLRVLYDPVESVSSGFENILAELRRNVESMEPKMMKFRPVFEFCELKESIPARLESRICNLVNIPFRIILVMQMLKYSALMNRSEF